MFAIAWQYLTGVAFAAEHGDREAAEWPPHPDRVFQALVAAWGERGERAEERDALLWLEAQGEPLVSVPDLTGEAARRKVFVPVNDIASSPLAPTRKERFFPAATVGDGVCALSWPDAVPGDHARALESLAQDVTRIGHSASLVRAWVTSTPPAPRWVPASGAAGAECHLRVAGAGRLAQLSRDFAGGGSEWRRPRTAAWAPYRAARPVHVDAGHHAGSLLVLRRVSGPAAGLVRGLGLAAALRARLLKRTLHAEARAQLSGHEADGAPLSRPHVAYVPLAFVDHEHADGHVLGLGLVLPRDTAAEVEHEIVGALASAMNADTGALELPFAGGSVTFVVEERPAPPFALRPVTWTAPSTTWASVTPVVLDRQPPRSHADPDGFVADTLVRACLHAGLPAPAEVRVTEVSALRGVPPARAFPPLPTKSGGGRRHVHAWFRFSRPVAGPLVLGAGRYRGLGFCRPLLPEVDR